MENQPIQGVACLVTANLPYLKIYTLILDPKITKTCGDAKWSINMQMFKNGARLKLQLLKWYIKVEK